MERKQRYGLRKLSIGVVSCFLGSVIYFGAGMTVNAEEIQADPIEEQGTNDGIAETTPAPALEESAPVAEPAPEVAPAQETAPAEETTPAEEAAPAQEAAPAEESTPVQETTPAEEVLKPNEEQENVIDEKGEVKWDGITEEDVNPGVDSRNGAIVTKPEFHLDYYHINDRQEISSLFVVDLRNTIIGDVEVIAEDSYTKYYGIDAYIVMSYIDGNDAMLVQVIEHDTHKILEEKVIANDEVPVILESTRSYSKNSSDLWIGAQHPDADRNNPNYIRAYYNGQTATVDQLDTALTDNTGNFKIVNTMFKVVYHSSLPQTQKMSSDIISSPVPNPISDNQITSYTVVDGLKQYVLDENGNKLTLADYTVVGYIGDNYHASEVRDINGFDLYKEEDADQMSGRLRKGKFVDGEEELITYYTHKDAMVDGVNVVRTRVFINDGTEGNVFVEIRYAPANLATKDNFSDMSIWTTMFRSESLAPGQISQTGNADSLHNAGGFSLDIDGDGKGDYIKGAYFDDWHKMPGGKLNKASGQNHSVWWIRNNRTVKSDDAEHVYIPQGTVRVHYIDEKGKVIKELVTAKADNVTKEFSVKEATEVNDGTKVSDVTYSLSRKGSSYDVTTEEYKPETIKFKDEKGNEYIYILKEVKTPSGQADTEEVTVKTPSGETTFTYNRTDAETSGTIDSATIYDVTYVYKLQGDVIVHYINEDGETIKEDVVDTPLSDIDTEYDTYDNKPKRITTEDGKVYELVEEKTKGNEEGKVVGGTTHITYVYKLLKGDVIVHYKDEEGKTIAKDVVDTKSSPTGTEYDTTDNKPQIIEFEGKEYEFVRWDNTTAKEQGKVVEKTTEVTYIYRLKKGNVIVHYKDEEGNTIKETVEDTPESPTGTKYDTTDNKPKRITTEDGKVYELVPEKTEGEETGKVKKGTTEVTYVYKLVKGDVIVHYVDEDGNTIKEDVVDTPTSPTGTTYDTTDNKPQRITKDGKEYELVPVKTVGKENGKVVEGTTHVTYVYKLVKGDVIVHYIDEDGNTIAEDVEDMPLTPVGTAYDTTDHKPKTIVFNGKTYVLVPEKTLGDEQGEIYEGTVHVVYVYKLVPDPVPTPPTPTPVPPKPADRPDPKLPEPTPTPEQPPVQTGMESGIVGAFSTMIASLGAMVAFKKKDNE